MSFISPRLHRPRPYPSQRRPPPIAPRNLPEQNKNINPRSSQGFVSTDWAACQRWPTSSGTPVHRRPGKRAHAISPTAPVHGSRILTKCLLPELRGLLRDGRIAGIDPRLRCSISEVNVGVRSTCGLSRSNAPCARFESPRARSRQPRGRRRGRMQRAGLGRVRIPVTVHSTNRRFGPTPRRSRAAPQ